MNLNDLMTKLRSIEEGAPVAPVHTDAGASDEGIEQEGIIIGGPMGAMMPPEQPKQQDSVTMNVSMNGSGSGGIKDLMSILRNIEQGGISQHGAEHDHSEPIFGDESMEEVIGDDEESWGNSMKGATGHHTHGVDAVTFSGDDMNSKGKISPVSRAPGTNPLREPSQFDESLVQKLQNLYNEVKTRDLNENVTTDITGHTLQHILHTHMRDVKDFEEGGDLSDSLYDALYDYYFDDMPYGTKKGRDGDPYEWISDRFAADIGISETIQMNKIQGVAEGAKWRDAKYKDRLYTQEPGDSDDYDNIGYGYDFPERPENDPGQKRRMGGIGDKYDRTDPLEKGYGRYGRGSPVEKGPRKGLPSRNHITSLKGSIKAAHGTHPRPNLPE